MRVCFERMENRQEIWKKLFACELFRNPDVYSCVLTLVPRGDRKITIGSDKLTKK